MNRETDWQVYGLCPVCGWKKRAPFGDISHIHIVVCPICATDRDSFSVVTMRWNMSKVKMFNPLTWNKGYWEKLDERNKSN